MRSIPLVFGIVAVFASTAAILSKTVLELVTNRQIILKTLEVTTKGLLP